MKFLLPVVLLSSFSTQSQGTPAPCPLESTPAITPQPTTIAPCPVVEEQAPAPTQAPVPTPEPTIIPCDEPEESDPVTEAPTPEPTAIPCDPEEEESVTEAPTPEPTAIPCDPEEEESVTEEPVPTPGPTVSETPAPTPEPTIIEEEYVLECDEEEEENKSDCGYQPLNAPAECDGTDGWYPISVEGVAGIFCVEEALCVADNADGHCPGPNAALPHGSICGLVRTGVYGCIPAPYGTYGCGSSDPEATPEPAKPGYPVYVDEQRPEEEPVDPLVCDDEEAPAECDGTDGWYPISVEGVAEIFCVKEQMCVEEIMGNCPGPRAGLPHGSVCDRVRTGVLGCVPAEFGTYECGSSDPEATPTYTSQDEESEPQSAYAATALSAGGSSVPAAAVGAIACAAIAVISALFIAGYRRHQRRKAADEAVISTPVGEENL